MHPDAPPLILASASAARRAMLATAGVAFTVQTSGVDEAAIKAMVRDAGGAATEAALMLAAAKASAIDASADTIILGADQILVCGDAWFDKPRDLVEAASHLRALRGRPHSLVTAAVAWRAGRQIWSAIAIPTLTMRPASDAFIDAYIRAEGHALLSTVGAYRIEGPGLQLFDAVEGAHPAIMGLPMVPLLRFLRDQRVLID